MAYNRGMIDFVAVHWGSLASIAGLIATIWIAWGARAASRSADRAARATRDDIRGYLQTVDLERAIRLIQRVKLLHNNGHWDAAMEQYEALRTMLSDIIARSPKDQTEFRQNMQTGISVVARLEDRVDRRKSQSIDDDARADFNQSLTAIEIDLRQRASDLGFGDSSEEAQ